MNVWLLYIIIFVIGFLFFLIGMSGHKKVARTIGLTAMAVVLIIAAVMIFVNKQPFIASEVFSFIK